MSKARLVITAVVVENRPVAEVVEAYGVSRSWVYELLARYRDEGEAASSHGRDDRVPRRVRHRRPRSIWCSGCASSWPMPAWTPAPSTGTSDTITT